MTKFWMIIKDSGSGSENTRKRHYDYSEARQEAERLARQEKKSFVVLEATARVGTEDIPVIWEPMVADDL